MTAETGRPHTAFTALPWRHYHSKELRPGFGGAVNEIHADCTDVPIVKWAGFDESERKPKEHAANAAYIVLCCNLFPDLVAALEEIQALFVVRHNNVGLNGELSMGKIYEIATAALFKARSAPPLATDG